MSECDYRQSVSESIDKHKDELFHISQCLWQNPELALKEFKAHDLLCNTLEKNGFSVRRKEYMETAFVATFQTQSYKAGPNIAFLCEYDALPEIGHGCGHNLIAEVGIGAAFGFKDFLSDSSIDAKITVLGTPAEENYSGKVTMIKSGAFKGIDVAMMSHPATATVCKPKLPSYDGLIVQFKGSPSHACTAPWEGVNALDAAVMAYQSLSVLRQQIKPDWRVSAIITKGGVRTYIIPQHAEMEVSYRTMTREESAILYKKVEACLLAAGTATGCQVTIERNEADHSSAMLHSNSLASMYEENCLKLGILLNDDAETLNKLVFSTDMGDVSYNVPSIHPIYDIKAKGPNHTTEFNEASGDIDAQFPTLNQAKCLALTAIDLILDWQKMKEVKQEFSENQNHQY